MISDTSFIGSRATVGASLLAALVSIAASAGCVAGDDVGGVGIALGDPAGVLDDAESVGVWAVRHYASIPTCDSASAGLADIVMDAESQPAGTIAAMVIVTPRAGSTELKLDDGVYSIVVEAYRRNAVDPQMFDIIGIGCAEVQVTGDGVVDITVSPRT